MLFLGKEVENTSDGRGRRRSVDGSEHEVAGLGGMDGGHEGFAVAHFADEHHVGVFADGVFHADFEVDHVHPDFALVDEGLGLGEHEFDGIFEREDVFVVVVVDPIEHRGDGRALTGAGDAGQQNHPLVELAKIDHRRWQVQSLEVGNPIADATCDQTNVPQLLE